MTKRTRLTWRQTVRFWLETYVFSIAPVIWRFGLGITLVMLGVSVAPLFRIFGWHSLAVAIFLPGVIMLAAAWAFGWFDAPPPRR